MKEPAACLANDAFPTEIYRHAAIDTLVQRRHIRKRAGTKNSGCRVTPYPKAKNDMDGLIEIGNKFHVVTRRMFADDLRRHFVGMVEGVAGEFCQMQGYSFVFDSFKNLYERQSELRTRIFALGDASYIVNKLPSELNVGSLNYRMVEGRLVVTDSENFTLDINEFGPKH